jgi:hypothetical protein
MIALLLLVPVVWITWVLFRDSDSNEDTRNAIASHERDKRDRKLGAGE